MKQHPISTVMIGHRTTSRVPTHPAQHRKQVVRQYRSPRYSSIIEHLFKGCVHTGSACQGMWE